LRLRSLLGLKNLSASWTGISILFLGSSTVKTWMQEQSPRDVHGFVRARRCGKKRKKTVLTNSGKGKVRARGILLKHRKLRLLGNTTIGKERGSQEKLIGALRRRLGITQTMRGKRPLKKPRQDKVLGLAAGYPRCERWGRISEVGKADRKSGVGEVDLTIFPKSG